MYHYSEGPHYPMHFGKIITQELHRWDHFYSDSKWQYRYKDSNDYWFRFYNALHNPTSTSEKIIDWHLYWSDVHATDQLWAYNGY